MKKLTIFSAFLILTLSCYPQKGKWKKAQKINTIESYQEFIANYPSSEFVSSAETKLIELEYEKSKRKNTIDAYTYFLNNYPNAIYTNDINRRLNNIKERIKEKQRIHALEEKENNLTRLILMTGANNRFIIPEIKAIDFHPKQSLTIIQIKNDRMNEIRFLSVLPNDYGINIIYKEEKLTGGGFSRSLYQQNKKTGKASIEKSTGVIWLPELQLGIGSIHRFNSTVYLDNIGLNASQVYSVHGSYNEPVVFLITKEGYVHLYGNGSITYRDGHSVKISDK